MLRKLVRMGRVKKEESAEELSQFPAHLNPVFDGYNFLERAGDYSRLPSCANSVGSYSSFCDRHPADPLYLVSELLERAFAFFFRVPPFAQRQDELLLPNSEPRGGIPVRPG